MAAPTPPPPPHALFPVNTSKLLPLLSSRGHAWVFAAVASMSLGNGGRDRRRRRRVWRHGQRCFQYLPPELWCMVFNYAIDAEQVFRMLCPVKTVKLWRTHEPAFGRLKLAGSAVLVHKQRAWWVPEDWDLYGVSVDDLQAVMRFLITQVLGYPANIIAESTPDVGYVPPGEYETYARSNAGMQGISEKQDWSYFVGRINHMPDSLFTSSNHRFGENINFLSGVTPFHEFDVFEAGHHYDFSIDSWRAPSGERIPGWSGCTHIHFRRADREKTIAYLTDRASLVHPAAEATQIARDVWTLYSHKSKDRLELYTQRFRPRPQEFGLSVPAPQMWRCLYTRGKRAYKRQLKKWMDGSSEEYTAWMEAEPAVTIQEVEPAMLLSGVERLLEYFNS